MIKIIQKFFSILSNAQKLFFYKLQILIIIAAFFEIASISGLAFYFSIILGLNDFMLQIKSIGMISNFSDKEIIVYHNKNDLIEKINYYLENNEAREQIAKAGQKKTLEHHNIEIRIDELLNIIEK